MQIISVPGCDLLFRMTSLSWLIFQYDLGFTTYFSDLGMTYFSLQLIFRDVCFSPRARHFPGQPIFQCDLFSTTYFPGLFFSPVSRARGSESSGLGSVPGLKLLSDNRCPPSVRFFIFSMRLFCHGDFIRIIFFSVSANNLSCKRMTTEMQIGSWCCLLWNTSAASYSSCWSWTPGAWTIRAFITLPLRTVPFFVPYSRNPHSFSLS